MAAIAGKDGKVSIAANTVAELNAWKLDVGVDTLDTTAFLDQWREFISGLKGWTGSASGSWDMTDTNGQLAMQSAATGGTTVSIRLYTNGSNYYSGTAYINGLAPGATVDGKVEVEFTFTGTGALSYI